MVWSRHLTKLSSSSNSRFSNAWSCHHVTLETLDFFFRFSSIWKSKLTSILRGVNWFQEFHVESSAFSRTYRVGKGKPCEKRPRCVLIRIEIWMGGGKKSHDWPIQRAYCVSHSYLITRGLVRQGSEKERDHVESESISRRDFNSYKRRTKRRLPRGSGCLWEMCA